MKTTLQTTAALASLAFLAASCRVALAAPLPPLPVTSNLVYWLDGDDLNGNGVAQGSSESGIVSGNVGTWVDKASGYVGGDVAQTALQGTSGNRPLFVASGLNTRSVVRFDGVDDFLKSAAFATPIGQPYMAFMVWKADSNGTFSNVAFDGLTSTNRGAFTYEQISGSIDAIGMFSGVGVTGNYLASSFSSPIYMTGVFNDTDNSTAAPHSYFRIDGSLAHTTTNTGSQSLDGVTVGSRFAPSSGDLLSLDGYIAEFLIYDSVLSDTDRDAVEEYLAFKWFNPESLIAGIPEPSTFTLMGIAGAALAARRGGRRRRARRA